MAALCQAQPWPESGRSRVGEAGCSSPPGDDSRRLLESNQTGRPRPPADCLVRADEIVRIHDSAVIESAIGSGGANQHATIREIDAEGCSPGVHVFAFFVQFCLTTDQDDDILGIVPLQGLGDISVASNRVSANALLVFL